MQRFVFMVAAVLYMASQACFGAEVVLHADGKDCAVRENGYGVKPNPLIFKGSIARVGPGGLLAHCNVPVPVAEYERRFQFCALTGVSVHEKGSCSLRRMDTGVMLFELSPVEGFQCSYTCVLK